MLNAIPDSRARQQTKKKKKIEMGGGKDPTTTAKAEEEREADGEEVNRAEADGEQRKKWEKKESKGLGSRRWTRGVVRGRRWGRQIEMGGSKDPATTAEAEEEREADGEEVNRAEADSQQRKKREKKESRGLGSWRWTRGVVRGRRWGRQIEMGGGKDPATTAEVEEEEREVDGEEVNRARADGEQRKKREKKESRGLGSRRWTRGVVRGRRWGRQIEMGSGKDPATTAEAEEEEEEEREVDGEEVNRAGAAGEQRKKREKKESKGLGSPWWTRGVVRGRRWGRHSIRVTRC